VREGAATSTNSAWTAGSESSDGGGTRRRVGSDDDERGYPYGGAVTALGFERAPRHTRETNLRHSGCSASETQIITRILSPTGRRGDVRVRALCRLGPRKALLGTRGGSSFPGRPRAVAMVRPMQFIAGEGRTDDSRIGDIPRLDGAREPNPRHDRSLNSVTRKEGRRRRARRDRPGGTRRPESHHRRDGAARVGRGSSSSARTPRRRGFRPRWLSRRAGVAAQRAGRAPRR
jgi:hypothetical protein